LRQARSRANPFESIAACFFQNRAAMKMANIDAVFNFMFTDPKHPNGVIQENFSFNIIYHYQKLSILKQSKVESEEPLFFCDVCAGPGGFSEYVLWRKKWKAKGFGLTLKAENDFCLDNFLAGAPEYFETHYGVNGVDGNGDVTNTANLEEFKKFVLEETNNRGVHFFMADGVGFENLQTKNETKF
jgi:cap1 methyltransferase